MTEPIAVDPPKPAFSRSAPLGSPVPVAPAPAPKVDAPKAEPSKLEAVLSALAPPPAPPAADVPVFAGFTMRHIKLGAAALASLVAGIGGVRMMFPSKDAPPEKPPVVAANTPTEKPKDPPALPPPKTLLEPGAPEKPLLDSNGWPVAPTPPAGPAAPLPVYTPPRPPEVPPPGADSLYIPVAPPAPPASLAPPLGPIIPVAGQEKPPAPALPPLPALPAPGGMGAPVAPPAPLVPTLDPAAPLAPPGNLVPPTAPGGMGTPPAPALPPIPGTGPTLPPVPPPGALEPMTPKPPPIEPPAAFPMTPAPRLEPPKVDPPSFAPIGAPPVGTPAAFTKPGGSSDARPLVPELAPRTSFDVELYEPKQGDSYDSISKEFYNDARFAKALDAFNRARNNGGRTVEVPPLHVLRKQFPQLMGGASAPPVISPASGTNGAGGLGSGGTFPPPPASGGVWGRAGDPPAPATPVSKTYRVPAGGTTMREIARTVLGSEQKWRDLYDLNGVLPDTVLPAGTEVKLP